MRDVFVVVTWKTLWSFLFPGTVGTFDKMTLFPTSHEVAPAVSAVGAGLGAVAIRTKVLHGKIVFAEAAVSGVPVAGVMR